ncbi:Ni/Co efflux regulator RcnB [Pseudaminobacter salicylatoxidans]|uniref:Ni/Co efflux regulator RcnB n=1 Tax=Pseudaminobacter salicylatoxidans TaxID=93369 RepID=A0A316C7X6_PSESE|nr:RcnB family protein [Pseudaminobacter salicylatoxidans]PWJ85156.1 Ni/Co efflux regulator RcnB [Pseudaminobacter salicylatoxidans]
MKRIALAFTALSILVAPVAAQAQGYGHQVEYRHKNAQSHKPSAHRPSAHKPVAPHKVQKKHYRSHWSKGKRLSDWKRRPAVRDYHRHGLKRPGHGQQWVRVDNNYMLVNLASGIIAGIVAGR